MPGLLKSDQPEKLGSTTEGFVEIKLFPCSFLVLTMKSAVGFEYCFNCSGPGNI